MIKSFVNCLIVSLLLISVPTPTKAVDNRETGLIVIGAAAACAGLYVICRETDKDTKRSFIRNFGENLGGALLVALGAASVLATKEVLTGFDKGVRALKGETTLGEDLDNLLN